MYIYSILVLLVTMDSLRRSPAGLKFISGEEGQHRPFLFFFFSGAGDGLGSYRGKYIFVPPANVPTRLGRTQEAPTRIGDCDDDACSCKQLRPCEDDLEGTSLPRHRSHIDGELYHLTSLGEYEGKLMMSS